MNREVIVRPAAERDFREAHSWYGEISPRLAEQFESAVDEAINSAVENPLRFQLLHRSLRRVLLHRFPYALFFVAEETRIIVLGVLHQSRSP
jgi:plasmid stabilization system protein ParE